MDNLAGQPFLVHKSKKTGPFPSRDQSSILFFSSLFFLFFFSFHLSRVIFPSPMNESETVISGNGRYRCPDGQLITKTAGQSAIIYLRRTDWAVGEEFRCAPISRHREEHTRGNL